MPYLQRMGVTMELTGRTSSSPTSFRYDALQCPELTTEGLLSAARQGNASGESYQHLKLGLPVLASHMLLQAHPFRGMDGVIGLPKQALPKVHGAVPGLRLELRDALDFSHMLSRAMP